MTKSQKLTATFPVDSTPAHVIAPPLARAVARLDLVLSRLSTAKDANPENISPLEAADAEALHGLVWAAVEDLQDLRGLERRVA